LKNCLLLQVLKKSRTGLRFGFAGVIAGKFDKYQEQSFVPADTKVADAHLHVSHQIGLRRTANQAHAPIAYGSECVDAAQNLQKAKNVACILKKASESAKGGRILNVF
jgi:hypothetical protein